jgi:hypothetical protein
MVDRQKVALKFLKRLLFIRFISLWGKLIPGLSFHYYCCHWLIMPSVSLQIRYPIAVASAWAIHSSGDQP